MAIQLVRFQALLDSRMYEKLRKESFKRHQSVSAIIRQALADYFLEEDVKRKAKKLDK